MAVDLFEVLVSDRERQSVLPAFGQDGHEAISGEVLKLVNVKVERPTLVHWHVGSPHGGQLDLGHHHCAKYAGVILAH